MAETTPTPANLSAVAHLEEALAHPEPMCLAMLEVFVPDSDPDRQSPVTDQVVEEAHHRLRDVLRDYDELTKLEGARFVVVLRTLAEASVLAGRMTGLYEIITRPYLLDGEDVPVEIFLGAAVRVPQETAAQLVTRVDQAVLLARSAPEAGPVLL